MRKRRKKAGEWIKLDGHLRRYGDSIAMLFVLLYSISSVDQSKWIKLVEVLIRMQRSQSDCNGYGSRWNDEVPGNAEATEEAVFDELYERLKLAVEDAGIETEVELTKGDGYTFVRFRDTMFFDGDSAVIRPEGKVILDRFAEAIAPASDVIQEIQVLGHTTQALPNQQNDVVSDRVLSSERAANVTGYLQQKNLVSPDKLVSVGYGQFRPVAPFDTEENRSKNRRVEDHHYEK